MSDYEVVEANKNYFLVKRMKDGKMVAVFCYAGCDQGKWYADIFSDEPFKYKRFFEDKEKARDYLINYLRGGVE